MKFYAQTELDELYIELKKKAYKDKSKWEKYLNDSDSTMRKKKSKQRDKEVPLEKLKGDVGK